jgi:hypothetical protein
MRRFIRNSNAQVTAQRKQCDEVFRREERWTVGSWSSPDFDLLPMRKEHC